MEFYKKGSYNPMRVMAKPSRQRHVRSVLCFRIDLDFAMMPGSVFGLPESIQLLIRSSRNVHRPFSHEFPGE